MVVLFTSNDSLALTEAEAAEVEFLQADVSEDASRIKKKFDERDQAILGSKNSGKASILNDKMT